MIKFLKRFIGTPDVWSIGIYSGNSPFSLTSDKNIRNPVLTAKNIIDRKALFVADPFMLREQDIWYMFFEVFNRETERGEIGLATSTDGLHWKYQQIILSESFHLAYPYVFKYENDFYIVPETYKEKTIKLYKATLFPFRWEFITDLLTGSNFLDSSIIHHNGIWWLFTCPTISNDILQLFYSSALIGPWFEHPANPIVNVNPHTARCGGRIIILNGKIIRFAQDDYPKYGNCLHAFEINKLTTTQYEEIAYPHNPILAASGKNWNKNGMHNINPCFLAKDKWLACVDGYYKGISLKVMQANNRRI